jgi:hypothetical protein
VTIACDKRGCTTPPILECACRRCGHEPDAVERFHSCLAHTADVEAQHDRMRQRDVLWIGYTP